ncbi:MAG: tetratricopeptide repeat protein [Prevotellaceae bacterium]|jgi:tetratricopeptide (TPR) repeat protein|nr:tetratricopeptide repeat protein [Prevotellaceae bacterium]
MKRVFFVMSLILMATLSYGQSKVVKQAKSAANSGKFAEARTLIKEALANPETKNDPEAWDVAGYIEMKAIAKENERQFLRQPFDTLAMFNSVLAEYDYYITCDSLAQLPDEKGRIRNKYRKNNAQTLLVERGNLISGGIHYYNKGEHEKEALKFFTLYLDTPNEPIFTDHPQLKADTLMPQVAYFAALTAMRLEDYPVVVKYGPIAYSDPANAEQVYQFVCTAYKEMGDTVTWLNELQAGMEKYPTNQFFFGNIVDYYNSANKPAEAMAFADNMLAKNPNDPFGLYVKAYLLHNAKQWDEALEYYQKVIAADPTYVEAYSNMGLIYCLQAEAISQNTAATDTQSAAFQAEEAKAKALYEKALPCFEKARELKPDNRDLWMQGLYRVYYILGMGDKFAEIEKLMGGN